VEAFPLCWRQQYLTSTFRRIFRYCQADERRESNLSLGRRRGSLQAVDPTVTHIHKRSDSNLAFFSYSTHASGTDNKLIIVSAGRKNKTPNLDNLPPLSSANFVNYSTLVWILNEITRLFSGSSHNSILLSKYLSIPTSKVSAIFTKLNSCLSYLNPLKTQDIGKICLTHIQKVLPQHFVLRPQKLKVWIKGCNPQFAPSLLCCPPQFLLSCSQYRISFDTAHLAFSMIVHVGDWKVLRIYGST
jgi:hypothetical protein